jgi:hypothetical protein
MIFYKNKITGRYPLIKVPIRSKFASSSSLRGTFDVGSNGKMRLRSVSSAEGITWKKFGQKALDGWLYGKGILRCDIHQ